jgi:hypothetical protein
MHPRFNRSALVLALLAARLVGQGVRPNLDAERLQTGLFRYKTLVDGKAAGESEIRIGKSESGEFVFTNLVEGAFSQSWEAAASRAFEPISAKLTMGRGKDARTVFDLAYHGPRVTGFAISGKGQEPRVRRVIDDSVAADTVDQRIDWAAVMAAEDYVPGGEFRFHVYDPGTGHSPVTARVLGRETTTVAAGSFETVRVEYRIEKNRGTETYEVLVKRELPRMLVTERFPNGAVTELTSFLAAPAKP